MPGVSTILSKSVLQSLESDIQLWVIRKSSTAPQEARLPLELLISPSVQEVDQNITLDNVNSSIVAIEAGITIAFFDDPLASLVYEIVNDSDGDVTLDGNGRNIYDEANFILMPGESATLKYTGSKWVMI